MRPPAAATTSMHAIAPAPAVTSTLPYNPSESSLPPIKPSEGEEKDIFGLSVSAHRLLILHI
jgi:hypothetical protein